MPTHPSPNVKVPARPATTEPHRPEREGVSTPGGQHTPERKHEKAPALRAEAPSLIETAGLAYR